MLEAAQKIGATKGLQKPITDESLTEAVTELLA